MIRISLSIALIAVAMLAATEANAQLGDWRVAGSIIWNDDDGDRNTDDSVSGIQINAGRDVTEFLTVEGVLGYSDIKGWTEPGLNVPDEKHLDLAANVLAFYDRDAVFAPYVMVGIGYMNVSYGDGSPLDFLTKPGEDGGTLTYTAGVGFKLRFGESPFSLRGEYRARGASDPISLTDRLATIGLEYRFGAKPRDLGVPQADKPADTDGDGVLDMWDACPDTPDGVDVTASGCEIEDMTRDVDSDRVPDHRDECPDTPRGAPVDPRGCSLDSDKDGVLTGQDRCPATRPGVAVDEYGCALDLDPDGDGVLIDEDRCPDTRPGARVDVYGCEIRDIITLPGVNFETGSDRLLPGTEILMQDAARTLNRYPDLNIEVAGHTDNVGSTDLNLGLSDRRAKTVLDHLVRYGVDPARLTFRGYGDMAPIADNATAEGRAANRRVELRIVSE